jgi:hypothetical protein
LGIARCALNVGNIMNDKPKIDAHLTEGITCPYCGYEDHCTAEYRFNRYGVCETWCGDCGEAFTVTEQVDYAYTSKKGHSE